MYSIVCCVQYIIVIILICQVSAQETKKNWRSPNAWAKSKAQYLQKVDSNNNVGVPGRKANNNNDIEVEEYENNSNQRDKSNSEDINLIFYLKLVKFLFNPQKMKINEVTGNYYRKIELDVTPAQLDQLKKLTTNSIDLDSIVTDILQNSKSDVYPLKMAEEFLTILTEYINYIWDFAWLISLSIRIKIMLQFLSGITIICLLSKYLRINWFVSVLFLVAFFLYEYAYTECYRQKDIKYMIDLKIRSDKNPCDGLNPTVANSLWNYFFPSNKEMQCKEYMNEHYERDNTKCTNGEIFNEFIKVLFYNQIQLFINNMIEILYSIKNTYGFVLTVIVSLMICAITYSSIGITIKSFIKYVLAPSGWGLPTQSTYIQQQQQEHQQQPLTNVPQHKMLTENVSNTIVIKIASEPPGRRRIIRKKLVSKNVLERQHSKVVELNETVSGVEILPTAMASKQPAANSELQANENRNNLDEEFLKISNGTTIEAEDEEEEEEIFDDKSDSEILDNL